MHQDTTAKTFIISSLVWMLLGMGVGLILAIKFVFPDFLPYVSWLGYGRFRPLHINLVLFGWLLTANMGLVYYLVPRLCGTPLYNEKMGLATATLWNLGNLAGIFTLLSGLNKGRPYAEYITPVALVLAVAWVLFCINIFATITQRKYRQMYVSLWYIMGAMVWALFVYVVGNTPVGMISGVNEANVNWFYGHSVVGLIFTPLGLGVNYYFLPKAANAPLYSHRLSIIGFWTIAFIYVWNGAHHLIFGPVPNWLQTTAIVFSIMMFIPVWTVVTNFFGTVKGEWKQLWTNLPVRYLIAGVVFYFLTCLQGPIQALRALQPVIHFTDWVVGHAHLALIGAFSYFTFGAFYYAVPKMMKTQLYSKRLAEVHFWLTTAGFLYFIISLWVGGVFQGIMWNVTDMAFVETVKAMRIYWIGRMLGGAMILAAQVIFVFNLLYTFFGGANYVRELQRPSR